MRGREVKRGVERMIPYCTAKIKEWEKEKESIWCL